MDDAERARITRLATAAAKLLTLYEEELTAYHLVIQGAKKKIPTPQFDFDGAFRRVLRTPGLHAEAEAEYAELEPLLHPISDRELPGALDRAASALERRLASYTK